jgi:AraC-like DNA-binding protein
MLALGAGHDDRDGTNAQAVSDATTLVYRSQPAFAAVFRRLTDETPSDWRRRER